MKQDEWEAPEGGELEDLYKAAGIPPAEWIPTEIDPSRPPAGVFELVAVHAHEYDRYVRDLARVARQMRAIRWQRWQMFIWGLTVGALLSPIVAGWFPG